MTVAISYGADRYIRITAWRSILPEPVFGNAS
jgi:hypothetical protein